MTPKKIKTNDCVRYVGIGNSRIMKSHVIMLLLIFLIVLLILHYNGFVAISRSLNCVTITTKIENFEYETNGKSCMKNYFRNYILIIVYNHPHYDSVDLLRKFYEPVFPNIFVCGPHTNKSYPNVTYIDINRGIFGYYCLAAAYKKYFFYEGYFYINDDVILNYWNLVKDKFDTTKIWQSNNQFGKVNLLEKKPTNWYWWISPYGFDNVVKATQQIKDLGEKYTVFKTMYDTFLKNSNGTPYAYNGRSDIAYIPRQYISKFHELSLIFVHHKTFLEVALPTMLRFLAPSSEIKTLKGFYIPGDVRKNDPRVVDSRYFWTTYLLNYNLWFIHPFKLHHNDNHNRDLNVLLTKEILIERTKKYTECY